MLDTRLQTHHRYSPTTNQQNCLLKWLLVLQLGHRNSGLCGVKVCVCVCVWPFILGYCAARLFLASSCLYVFLRRSSCLKPSTPTAPNCELFPQLLMQLASWNIEQKQFHPAIKNTSATVRCELLLHTERKLAYEREHCSQVKRTQARQHLEENGLPFDSMIILICMLVFFWRILIMFIGITQLGIKSSIFHWTGEMGIEFVAASSEA